MRAAIIIGCSAYDDPQIADLNFAHRDGSGMAEALTRRCGVPPENLFKILGADDDAGRIPTRSEVFRILARGPEIASRQSIETLFLFFSGHGWHARDTSTDYLVLKDTVPAALAHTALAFDVMIGMLTLWRAERTVVILDACRSFFEAGKGDGGADTANDFAAVEAEGMIVIRSCSPGERSFEADALRMGVFTAALLRALDDEARCATYYEIDRFLAADVPALGARHGKPPQTPMSRIEPLSAQGATMVSRDQAAQWRRTLPIGAEIRTRLATAAPEGAPWSDMIAIDLGASTSVVGVASEGLSEVRLVSVAGTALLPSAVHLQPDLSYVTGREATRRMRVDPAHGLAYFKRDLGGDWSRNLYGRSISAEEAASLIVRSLKRDAETVTGVAARRLLASYPVNFSTAQLNGLVEAYRLAGFDHIRLMPEPCAAALTLFRSHFPREDGLHALILDLGGGTLDVAAVEVGDDAIEVLAVDGLRDLGGRDYDILLADHLRGGIEAAFAGVEIDAAGLLAEAERCKILLTSDETAAVLIDLGETDDGGRREYRATLTRDEVRRVFQPIDDRVLSVIDSVLAAVRARDSQGAGFRTQVIVLAGMGARVFTVGSLVKRRLPEAELSIRFQENAVAHGLCEYLKTLALGLGKGRSWLVLNVVGKTLSIRAAADRRGGPKGPDVGGHLSISDRVEANGVIAALVDGRDTIPTRLSTLLTFEGEGDSFEIPLLEAFPSDAAPTVAAKFLVRGRPKRLELAIEIDHTGIVVVIFRDEHRGHAYQINHFHDLPYLYAPFDGDPPGPSPWRVEATGVRRVTEPAWRAAQTRPPITPDFSP